MKKFVAGLFIIACFVFHASGADTSYRQVLIFTNGDSVRVRLPLTAVTGKVRVKEKTPTGFGVPVAPTRTPLDAGDYIEWQIGYDIPNTNSPSVVPQLKFRRNGEMKYGHELSKIIFDAVQLRLLSTNDLVREIETLKQMQPDEFEENRPVQVKVSTNSINGFRSSVELLPQFTKTTPYGSVQIQLKQKQHAVGYQAMIYVCLPMDQVLEMNGNLRPPGHAKTKETIYYDFNRKNAGFILDIVYAFGIASEQHNKDLRQILGKILETAKSG